MMKRTLHFGNPVRLSVKKKQVLIETQESDSPVTVPIEDIGLVIFENMQITFTNYLISELLKNNTAVIICNDKHYPQGLLLNMVGNTIQTERFRTQIEAKLPLKKRMWAQTIKYKFRNQAKVLELLNKPHLNLLKWSGEVLSGDSNNIEAKAATYYWKTIFTDFIEDFTRGRFDEEPNNLLNYGYSILRAVVARALVSSGLIPSLGINHRNKYNPFCLADDIMEPYRPYVDLQVIQILRGGGNIFDLDKELKTKLLSISTIDVMIDGNQKPLMNAVTSTTASLFECFDGQRSKIKYPKL
jgi:CRISPR-associated protein Cas1